MTVNMSLIKLLLFQTIPIILVFFAFDYIYTNFLISSDGLEKKYRVENEVYHHTLKASFNGVGNWGGKNYRICTDRSGFKSSCNAVNNKQQYFDIGFIGDSFTEAIGMSYEDSFVGMFAKKNKHLKIANLGVSTYSPTIYYTKLKYFLESGYFFDHIYIFVDIGDIHDESYYLRNSSGNVIQLENNLIYRNSFFHKIKVFIASNFILLKTAYRTIKKIIGLFSFNIGHDDKDTMQNISNLVGSDWLRLSYSQAYGQLGINGSINKAIKEMNLVYELLENNNIKLSVGVYPWPDQLSEIKISNYYPNKHVRIWKDFCLKKCKNFINMFTIYNEILKSLSVEDVYKKYYINGDVHFNKEGNRLIFKFLDKLNHEQ